jgi:hypothetical protein
LCLYLQNGALHFFRRIERSPTLSESVIYILFFLKDTSISFEKNGEDMITNHTILFF